MNSVSSTGSTKEEIMASKPDSRLVRLKLVPLKTPSAVAVATFSTRTSKIKPVTRSVGLRPVSSTARISLLSSTPLVPAIGLQGLVISTLFGSAKV